GEPTPDTFVVSIGGIRSRAAMWRTSARIASPAGAARRNLRNMPAIRTACRAANATEPNSQTPPAAGQTHADHARKSILTGSVVLDSRTSMAGKPSVAGRELPEAGSDE